MKTKIALSLLLACFGGLTGCQSESEVDKCVDAFIKADEMKSIGLAPLPPSEKSSRQAEYRLSCLNASSGKR